MSIRSLVSPIALAAATALSLNAVAFAQTMVGDLEISDADLPTVTEHCEALANADMTDEMATNEVQSNGAAGEEAAGDDIADDATTTEETPMAGEMPTDGTMAGETPSAGGTTDAGAENVDDTLMVDAITLDDCQAAGLIE